MPVTPRDCRKIKPLGQRTSRVAGNQSHEDRHATGTRQQMFDRESRRRIVTVMERQEGRQRRDTLLSKHSRIQCNQKISAVGDSQPRQLPRVGHDADNRQAGASMRQ